MGTSSADEALLQAASYIQRAVQLYEEALERDPNNQLISANVATLRSNRFGTPAPGPSQESMSELVSLFQKGQFSVVVDKANKMADEFPSSVVLWNIIGTANKVLGRFSEAEHSFRKTVELDPSDPSAHNNLGVASQDYGKFEEAITSFRQAIQLKPDYAEAYYNLGGLFYVQGDLDAAALSYQRAILLNPDYVDAHYNLGDLFRQRGNFIDAAVSYERAILLKPDEADSHFKLGITLGDLALPNQNGVQFDLAAASLQRALQLEPNFAEAHFNLGLVCRAQGKYDDARMCFENALRLKPDYAEAHNSLGVAMQELGDFDKAKDSFTQAIRSNSRYVNGHKNLSSIIKYTRDHEHLSEMINLYSDTGVSAEDRGTLCFALGKAFEDIGDIDMAFKYISEANRVIYDELVINRDYRSYRSKAMFSTARMIDTALPKDFGLSSADSITPIFIVGMARSGTTLVEQIISSHSRVRGLGETLLLWNAAWPLIGTAEIFADDGIEKIRRSFLEEAMLHAPGYDFVTDKLTLNFLLIGVIVRALPEAKIIHVARDPRAVCWSNYKSLLGLGIEYSHDIDETVDYYNLYSDIMRYWNEAYPGRIYKLQYEDLVRDQESQTRLLVEHIGLEWEDACLEFYKNDRAVVTASYHQVRQKMFSDSSESWRKFERFVGGPFARLDGAE